MKTHRLLIVAMLLLALLLPGTGALAKMLSAFDVSGPGIEGTLRIDDPDEIMHLMDEGFYHRSQPLTFTQEQIAALGEPYTITVYVEGMDMEGAVVHRSVFEYYLDPQGGRGYYHWIGYGLSDQELTLSDEWTRALPQGEAAFWDLMSTHGLPAPGTEAAEPLLSTLPDGAAAAWQLPALGAGLALALTGAAILIWRARHRREGQVAEAATGDR